MSEQGLGRWGLIGNALAVAVVIIVMVIEEVSYLTVLGATVRVRSGLAQGEHDSSSPTAEPAESTQQRRAVSPHLPVLPQTRAASPHLLPPAPNLNPLPNPSHQSPDLNHLNHDPPSPHHSASRRNRVRASAAALACALRLNSRACGTRKWARGEGVGALRRKLLEGRQSASAAALACALRLNSRACIRNSTGVTRGCGWQGGGRV